MTRHPHQPSMEKVRSDIENCVCPFCGRGPFKSTAMHVQKIHDINRHRLRKMAGMTTSESLASPELREHMSRIAKARLPPDERSVKMSEISQRKSVESRTRQGRSIAAHYATNPMTEERKAKTLALLRTPEAQAKRMSAWADRRLSCGSAAAYRRGCRCEACREAKRGTR